MIIIKVKVLRKKVWLQSETERNLSKQNACEINVLFSQNAVGNLSVYFSQNQLQTIPYRCEVSN